MAVIDDLGWDLLPDFTTSDLPFPFPLPFSFGLGFFSPPSPTAASTIVDFFAFVLDVVVRLEEGPGLARLAIGGNVGEEGDEGRSVKSRTAVGQEEKMGGESLVDRAGGRRMKRIYRPAVVSSSRRGSMVP